MGQAASCFISPKSAATAKAPPTPTPRLLSLPGELRNQIYRLALVDHDQPPLLTAAGMLEPGLLSVCKQASPFSSGTQCGLALANKRSQVRKESGPIFYRENDFEVTSVDFESEAFCFLTSKSRCLYKEFGRQARWRTCRVLGPRNPNWSNLLAWMHSYHRGRTHVGSQTFTNMAGAVANPNGFVPRGNVAFSIVFAMFSVVEAMKDKPWDRVKPILMNHREAMVALDPLWGN